MPIRVLIAEPQPMFRVGIQRTLETARDIKVLGAVPTASAALAQIRSKSPDIAVAALALEPSSFDLLRDTHDQPTRIIMLSSEGGAASVYRAMLGGACAYLSREVHDLVDVVRRVYAQEVVLPPPQLKLFLEEARRLNPRPFDILSSRERDVLSHIQTGDTHAQVANTLNVSVHTVKGHLKSIYRKLGVNNQTAAVASAKGLGIIR